MAVTNIQSVDTGVSTAAASTSKTLTVTAPTQNNLICLVVITADGTGLAISGMTGWTLQETKTSGTGVTFNFYYKIAGASEGTSVTATTTNSNRWGMWFGEYSGVDTSNPIDGSVSDFDANTSVWSPPVYPGYTGGAAIHVGGIWNFGSVGNTNTPVSLTNTCDESLNLRSPGGGGTSAGVFSHRVGSDTRGLAGFVYDNLAPDAHSKDCKTTFTATSWTSRCGGITVVVRASGASANLAVSSTGGSGAMVQSRNQPFTTVSSASPALVNNTVVGNLLFMVWIIQNDGATITAAPAGWALFGSHISTTTSTNDVAEGVEIWWKICTATTDKAPGSWTLSGSSSGSVTFHEASGCSVANPTTNGLAPTNHPRRRSILATSVAATASTASRSRTLTTGNTLEYAVFSGQVGGSGNLTNMPTAADTTWTNTVGPSNGTRVVGVAAYKMSLGAGELFVRCDHGVNGAGSTWQCGSLITFSFEMAPAGQDHWGWAEGSDAMDSWHAYV